VLAFAKVAEQIDFALKLLGNVAVPPHAAGARIPPSPADLTLRIVNHMVDGYLACLTKQE
jgi:hypothetical protein